MFRFIIHAAALIAINLIAIRVGLGWDDRVHQQHPFAAVIPIGALVSLLVFWFWYHAVNALDAGKWKLLQLSQWRLLFVIALVLAPICFFVVPSPHEFSKGRFLTVTVFTLVVNALTLGILIPQRDFNSARFFRALIARRWFRRVLAGCGMTAITMMLLLCVEGICYWRNRAQPPGPKKVYEGEYLTPEFSDWDPDLGKKLMPDADVACRLKVDDKTVWDVRYSTDDYGRRTTITPDANSAENYAVFFGCSFLFGEGANDEETIPSQFAAAAPKYRAYNYGVPGYGTQQMLAKLESDTIREEVTEKKGVVFYLYLEEVHEPRVIGGMQVANSFAQYFPYYDFDSSGKLQRFGNFTTGRPMLSKVYGLLGKSQFVKSIGLNFPKRQEEHYQLVSAIVEQSQILCREQLGCENFYVVCYPHKSPHHRLLPYLKKAGIQYLDHSQLFDPNSEGWFHKGDGHPTPLANQTLATQLFSDIESVR